MKILFAFYPLFVEYNHGIALLSALCKRKGIETGLVVLSTEDAFEQAIEDYSIVGFSCVTVHDYRLALPFMRLAKERGKIVLLGGTYPRMADVSDAPADYICKGEAELLPDFLLYHDTSVFDNRMVCSDLSSLPLPDYDLFEPYPFKRTDLLKGKVLPYFSSRGCTHRCRFCQVRYQPSRLLVRASVQRDLEYLKDRYRPDCFFLGDELVPYYSREWRDSWGEFKHPFFAYIRADVPPKILEWLIGRGMIACAFGVESGDERYRNEVLGKNLSDKVIIETVRILKENGVIYAPFYMTGTPGETEEIRVKTLSMLRELGGFPFLFTYEELNVCC